MLFILRKLRRSFFLPGKLRTYLAYAVGEIVLIVIGILIALKISDWNQGLTNQGLEQAFLQRLHKDLEADLEEFKTQVLAASNGIDAMKEAVMLIQKENNASDLYKFNELYDLAGISPLKPQIATYRELESTGQLNLIRDETLRVALQDHYAKYESLSKEFESIAAWMVSISSSFETQTAVMKYTHETRSLFPTEMQPEQDWAFFNDPSHTHYALLESTIASRAYRAQTIVDFYGLIIPEIEVLITQITEALKQR